VFQEIPGIGEYFVALNVLAPSFVVAMFVGFIVSKKYPPRAEAIQVIEEIDATPDAE
jgi:sodium/proline symporter